MSALELGPLAFDVEQYAIQGNGILGIKDSGKSYAATMFAEKLMDSGVPIIALDPIGMWRFLRVAGKGPGYPVVVAGGENGDLPLTPHGAPEIVRAAMRDGISLVLDLYSMSLTKADWRAIVAASVRTLLYENKQYGLRHVFIEEAAEFAPQRVTPDYGKVYAEVEKLARMGGNASLGYTLISQRAEEVNKAVLELCDALFLFRQKGKNSLISVGKWLDAGGAADAKQTAATLPTLAQGECWVWPAGAETPIRVPRMPEKRTFHPDRRVMRSAKAIPQQKTVDVSAFVQHMSGTLEKIIEEAKANDPKELRAEIVRLKRDLAAQAKAPPGIDAAAMNAALDAAEKKSRETGYAEGWHAAVKALGLHPQALADHANDALHIAGEIETWLKAAPTVPVAAPAIRRPAVPVARPSPVASARVPRRAPANGHGTGEKLASGARKILTILAQYQDGRSKRQVALLAGYAVSGGGFNNYLSDLRVRRFIDDGGDNLTITDAGLAALGEWNPLPTGRELLDHWLRQLGRAERACLEALAGAYPEPLTKEQVADEAGYEANGGGFNNALSRLRTLELIEGRGELRAAGELFE